MNMLRIRMLQWGVGVAALVMAQSAVAQSLPVDAPLRLTDEELGDMRGGYLTAGGVVFDFGAIVRTYVGGALALETRLTWTPGGPLVEQTSGGLPGWTSLPAGGVVGGLDLTGLPAGSAGQVLSDANGTTALIHNVQGQLLNMVINAADHRDIHQDMQVMLTLPEFESMQHDYSIDRLGSAISRDFDWSGVQGVGR